MSQPHVSVIVPHYNDLVRLDQCLAALVAQTYPRDQFEIIVSDNASPQGEAAVAAAIAGRARLVITPKKGAGPARNGGAAVARGEILAFTDSDCVPEPQWLTSGVEALKDGEFVGGAMRVLVGDEAHMTGAEAYECVFGFRNQIYVERKGFTVTANLFCAAALFKAVGDFRTGVSEDIEWCERAGAAGYRIRYASDALVGHPARRSLAELQTKHRRIDRELYALHLDKGGSRALWFLRAVAQLLALPLDVAKVLRHPRLDAGARVRALGVLGVTRVWIALDRASLIVQPVSHP